MFNYEQFLIMRDYVTMNAEEEMQKLNQALSKGHVVIITWNEKFYLFIPRVISWSGEASGNISKFLTLHGEAFAATVLEEQELARMMEEMDANLPGIERGSAVVVNKEGQLIGYCTAVQLLKAIWKKHQQTVAYFQTLLETVSDAVTVVDQSGTVIGWNSIAEEMYGIHKSEILGRTIGEHFDPEALVVLKILDEGRRTRNAYHRPRSDTHVLINASPIMDNQGKIIGGVATEQDITHLVKLNDELATAHSHLYTHRMKEQDPFAMISSRGERLGKVLKIAKKIAETDSSILLTGETGAGKEELAKVIHQVSLRSDGPFLAINCAAIPPGLLETELFGFEGGLFSGQRSREAGMLEAADGGSLFLNEIESLPMDIQDKLYLFMKNRKLTRMGGQEELGISTRIIAATSQNLEQLVQEGTFRSDLYYALNAVSLHLPPLRERKEDLSNLVQMYLRVFSQQYQRPVPTVSPEVMLAFMNYDWPGNLTELRATMERVILLSENDQIMLDHLPEALQKKQVQLEHENVDIVEVENVSRGDGVDRLEKMLRPKISTHEEILLMKEALRRSSGNKSHAAKLLGISRGTLYKKIREHNLDEMARS